MYYQNVFPKQTQVDIISQLSLLPYKRQYNREVCDVGVSYSYNGNQARFVPFPPLIQKLSELAMKFAFSNTIPFNQCCINKYESGNNSLGSHCDNEPEVDSLQEIVSISFGVRRNFLLSKQQYYLGEGDIIVFNSNQFHSIPKDLSINETRYNLTFRVIKP